MAECPALKALENTNEESGFPACTLLWIIFENLVRVSLCCNSAVPLSDPGKWSSATGTRNSLQLWGQLGELCELCYASCVPSAAQHGIWHVSHPCGHLLSIQPWLLTLNTDGGVLSPHFRETTQYPRFMLQDWTPYFGLDPLFHPFSMVLWLDFHHSSFPQPPIQKQHWFFWHQALACISYSTWLPCSSWSPAWLD